MAIKMRVNNDTSARCGECGALWKNSSEMYDLFIFGEIHQICLRCSDKLFQKTLRASCAYNGKVKQKEDLNRAEREKIRTNIQTG